MVSAQVDITWGTPCTLTATFVINNKTAKPIDVQLGFPITNVYLEKAGKLPNDIIYTFDEGLSVVHASRVSDDPIVRKLDTIIIDKVDFEDIDIADTLPVLNEKSKAFDPEHKGVHFALRLPPLPADLKGTSAQQANERRIGIEWKNVSLSELLDRMMYLPHLQYSIEGDTVYFEPRKPHRGADFAWYRYPHTFPPGSTTVTVATRLPASLVYESAYRESLYYCIETGGSWDGTIGSEEVAIHFPGPVIPGQIISADPAGYSVEGNSVRWKFLDFKPKGTDHDIDIEYFRPDMVVAISQARSDLARDPSNPTLILNLVRDLFVLGPAKGYAPFPPDNLSLDELNHLLTQIKNEKDRASFKSFYSLNDKGKYEESENSWQANREETLRILNSIDYEPPSDRSPYVDEARALLEKLLHDQPTNALAWNIYFYNYYRFHFAGGTFEIGDPRFYPHERDQLKKAISFCPQDLGLKLRYQVMTHLPYHNYEDPDILALREQMKKDGVWANGYGEIQYDYY